MNWITKRNALISFLTVGFFIISISPARAQKNDENASLYKACIIVQNQDISREFTGCLYQLKDSSIVISNSFSIEDYENGRFLKKEYKIKDIKL